MSNKYSINAIQIMQSCLKKWWLFILLAVAGAGAFGLAAGEAVTGKHEAVLAFLAGKCIEQPDYYIYAAAILGALFGLCFGLCCVVISIVKNQNGAERTINAVPGERLKQWNKVILLTYGLFMLDKIFSYTQLYDLHAAAHRYVLVWIIVVLLSDVFIRQERDARNVLLFTAVSYAVLLSYISCGDVALISSLIIILLVMNQDFDKIVKATLLVQVVSFVVVSGLAMLGVLDDRISMHPMDFGFASLTVPVHYLGFIYYATPCELMMGIVMAWAYLRKESAGWWEGIAWLGILCMQIAFCFARASTLLTAVFILLFWIVYRLKWLPLKSKFAGFISGFGFVVCAAVSVIIPICFRTFGSFASLNSIVHGRINLSAKALTEYSIRLFGQYSPIDVSGPNYFYIDSDYVLSLVVYGIICTVLILIMYSLVFRYAYRSGNRLLYIWMALMMIMSMTNNTLLIIYYNPLIFCLPEAIRYFRNNGPYGDGYSDLIEETGAD